MTRWFVLIAVSLVLCAGCAQEPSVPSSVAQALNAPEAARAAATATNDQSAVPDGETDPGAEPAPATGNAPDTDPAAPARPDASVSTIAEPAESPDDEPELDAATEAEIKKLKDEIDRLLHESEDDPYEQVIPLLHRVQQLDPHDVDAYLDEAWQHYSHGQGTPREKELDRKAVSVYQRAMSKNPADPRVPWEYGFLFHYKHRKDFAAGTVWMEKACRLAKNSQYSRVLGGIYETEKRPKDACRLYARALELNPDDSLAKMKFDRLGCGGK